MKRIYLVNQNARDILQSRVRMRAHFDRISRNTRGSQSHIYTKNIYSRLEVIYND